MLEAVVALALFALVGEPLLVLLHELGHAVAPLLRGHETAVFVGGEVGYTASVGPLTVTVAPRGFLRPVTFGATATEVDVSRGTVVAAALGGPAVSLLLLAVVFRAFDWNSPGLARTIAILTVLYLGFQALFSLLPRRHEGEGDAEGYRSDGVRVVDAVLGRDRSGK